MKLVQCLSDLVVDELDDAEKYINLALRYKDEDKDTSKMFYELSLEEMKHMNKLHERTVALISDYKAKNGAPPEGMLAVYNYLHEKQIERTKEIKVLQDMF